MATRPPAQFTSLPAPVGGLNDRDSIVGMKPNEAIGMENWWTYPTYIATRKGSTAWLTGLPGQVRSLMEYAPINGNSKLLAACSGNIYDATTQGAAGAPIHTSFGSSDFQTAMVTIPGGSFLIMVNGVDKMHAYNGSTFTIPTVNSVDSATFASVVSFKNRLFFGQKTSLKVFYLPVNAYAGHANEIDLGAVFNHGGSINAVFNWTVDAGDGMDDRLAVITTNGELAVFTGTDPSNANTWALHGVFYVGIPLGRRCGTKLGGDLILNTLTGVFPLSQQLLSATINRQAALTDKIQNAVSLAAGQYRNNFGWQVTVYADNNAILLNVPKGNGANFQYVQNTITGAWTKFIGWDATVMLVTSAGLFYGNGNSVQKAWVGDSDNSVPITATVLPSYQYFGNMARNKMFTMVKPYMLSNGRPRVLYDVNVDFVNNPPTGELSYEATTGMVWNAMNWGNANMKWGGDMTVFTSGWKTVGRIGNAATLSMIVQNNGSEVQFMNWSAAYQQGGVLDY